MVANRVVANRVVGWQTIRKIGRAETLQNEVYQCIREYRLKADLVVLERVIETLIHQKTSSTCYWPQNVVAAAISCSLRLASCLSVHTNEGRLTIHSNTERHFIRCLSSS
jgi:hypothetical protein